MVKSCCAIGCTNCYKKGSGIQFYIFPQDKVKRAQWIAAVEQKNWKPNSFSWICSVHFVSGSKSNNPLSPDYVPSIFNHLASPARRRAKEELDKFRRRSEVKKRRVLNCQKQEAANSLLSLSNFGNGITYCEPYTGTCTMTDLSMAEISVAMNEKEELESLVKSLTKKIETLETENAELRQTSEALEIKCQNLKQQYEQEKERSSILEAAAASHDFVKSLQGQDEKVKYYTGLPTYTCLIAVFELVFPPPQTDDRFSLPYLNQFVLLLMKMRLNLGDQDLGYRFGVHQSTISRYFNKVLNVMYTRLQPLVKWPGKKELLETMPTDFQKHFGRCIVVIDCFEVFLERPSNPMARAQTFSNYKHHNTVKFLVGIAPQGAVTFISRGWGGRVSDVYLTENCGLLNNLSHGDLVLADRGFTIDKSVGIYCAEVKIPPFTRGKPQLTKSEVDFSRQLSRVRIHVERVIGMIRQKYTLLESTVPITFVLTDKSDCISTLDKIVFVCCALCNCCPSVVNFD